jgi:hypothetical protein
MHTKRDEQPNSTDYSAAPKAASSCCKRSSCIALYNLSQAAPSTFEFRLSRCRFGSFLLRLHYRSPTRGYLSPVLGPAGKGILRLHVRDRGACTIELPGWLPGWWLHLCAGHRHD